MRVPAAKTEFKTIASKIIQHPAVTIERIKLRRRVIELSVQTRLGGAAAFNHAAATPDRAVRMAGGSAKPRAYVDDRILKWRGNETRSLS